MKTLEDVREWLCKVNGLFSVLHETQELCGELRVRVRHAQRMDHQKAQVRWTQELRYTREQLQLSQEDLYEATATPDVADALEMITDVRVLTQEASDRYETWRHVLARRSLFEREGNFEAADGLRGPGEEAHLGFQLALAMAIERIPQTSEVMRL